MKKVHIASVFYKCLIMIAMLTECNNDKAVSPAETSVISTNDQNAKGNALLRLVKRGLTNIQYVKSGKFFGKISKVTDPTFRTEYTYDDNNPNGVLNITSKRYKKSTNILVEEIHYKVSNGLCFKSENITEVSHKEYHYNAQDLLDEVNMYMGITGAKTLNFTYLYSAATNAYRLSKIESNPNVSGLTDKVNITYTSQPDNYSLNPDYIGVDKYLPIFGRFSDVLVEQYIESPLGSLPLYHKFVYAIDSDGYATLEQIEHSYGGPKKWYDSVILQYSSNWQGIP